MKVSYNWLKEFIDLPWDARELADRLETSGTAVESITDYAPGFSGVVTGVITAIEAHPQADKLRLTTVDAGQGEALQIVCGASNIEVGQKIPVALIGAELPGGHKISQATLRGVASFGMLCSETELELGDDARGIMILDAATQIGRPLEEILNISDTVIEFEITPNRPDCMSMIGMAREVAALTGGVLRRPSAKIEPGNSTAAVTITIEAADQCPRYTAHVVSGVKVAPSPFWMRSRLSKAGIRPINNMVDITNYVLLETGQPLHAFDLAHIAQGKIAVRRAAQGEVMTTLDGVDRSLNENMLVIADGAGPVALAGIMGGAATEIDDNTTMCVLESAYFEPTGIFKTSSALDLRSEASARFERGTDPNGTLNAVDRAAALLVELAGGTVAGDAIDVYPEKIVPLNIVLDPATARAVIGADIGDQDIRDILKSLEIPTKKESSTAIMTVEAPTFRPDLTREIDLVEEIARVYGFANIPATIPDAHGSAVALTAEQHVVRTSRDILSAVGLRECICYAFIDPADLARLVLPDNDPRTKALALQNPLSANQSVMRPTLLPGLLRTARFNAGYGNDSVQLFEIGRVFRPARAAGQMPEERNVVSGVLTGAWQEDAWYGKRRPVDFYDLKGVVETYVNSLSLREVSIEVSADNLLSPGQRADLYAGGVKTGSFGLVHPTIAKNYDLSGDVYAFELEAGLLTQAVRVDKRVVAPVRYPSVTRDISVFVDRELPVAKLTAVIRRAGGETLADVRLFDLYEGDGVPAGQKSLGYRLVYQDAERTLTIEETDAAHAVVLQALQSEFKVQIR